MKLTKTLQEKMDECGTWHKKFALLPTLLDDGSLIWLSSYQEQKNYYKILWQVSFYKNRRAL